MADKKAEGVERREGVVGIQFLDKLIMKVMHDFG